MATFNIDTVAALCGLDSTWIKDQIKLRRKIGLVGKDLQRLINIIQDEGENMSEQSINIWLVIADEEIHQGNERILKLLWPKELPKLTRISNDFWTWAWYKSPILPNLKVWLYQYMSTKEKYLNSLQRGIVYSIEETDNAFTTMDLADDSATTFYINLVWDSPFLHHIARRRSSYHSQQHCLILNCHSDQTATSSIRLPIQL